MQQPGPSYPPPAHLPHHGSQPSRHVVLVCADGSGEGAAAASGTAAAGAGNRKDGMGATWSGVRTGACRGDMIGAAGGSGVGGSDNCGADVDGPDVGTVAEGKGAGAGRKVEDWKHGSNGLLQQAG